jgi:uncharacterized protein with PIN domain
MEREDSPPKFIVDVMLGRLARWLRLLGYDVLYDNAMADREIVDIALAEDRIILTRDRKMLERRKVKKYLLIQDDFFREQLRQVLNQFAIVSYPHIFTRCLNCNSPLEAVAKESVQARVPPYVYQTQEEFVRCPSCDKIYWSGTHKEAVLRQLGKVSA